MRLNPHSLSLGIPNPRAVVNADRTACRSDYPAAPGLASSRPAAPASLSSLHSSTACVIREVPYSRLGFLEGFEHMLLAVYFTCLPSAAFERTGFLNGSRCVARSDSESSLAKMTPSRRPHCLPQFSCPIHSEKNDNETCMRNDRCRLRGLFVAVRRSTVRDNAFCMRG